MRQQVIYLAALAAVLNSPVARGENLTRGEAMIENYFRLQVARISDECLKDFRSRAQWEEARPRLRGQFLEMLGLSPPPAKNDLQARITGLIEAENYTVQKLVYQSLPNLYVTALFYLPRPLPKEKLPVVLYLCGHANVVKQIDGNEVSFGAKMAYQRHPAWLAEHGYACLIIDTLQLSEIPGIHHGTYRLGMWWWQALGYTPAGVECWNGIRALDYLETRPEVDMKRLGVTGRSGGGAYSWWLAAADDRPQCIIPVAGIADLQAHLYDGYPGRLEKGAIAGHCDCMFMVNTYRWDFPAVAALCAPRPLMLANSDKDDLFPAPSYRRLADKVRRIYDLYGAGDRFVVLETRGPHQDTPELRLGAFAWLNKWLRNDAAPVSEGAFEPLPPERLKVLSAIPEGALNDKIQDFFIKRATIDLPSSAEVARQWWQGEHTSLENELRRSVFHGWPEQPPALHLKPAGDTSRRGLRLRTWDFDSEDGIELRLWLMTAAGVDKPVLVVLNALDDAGLAEWRAQLGDDFAAALQSSKPIVGDEAESTRTQRMLEKQKWAFAAVCPRGIGPTKWAQPGSQADMQIRRRFALIGQTLDGQRVWDVRRALSALREVPDLKGAPQWLQGKNEMAGIALYAGLFEPDVARLDLWNLPSSHLEAPIFLNVRKYLDVPQALALASPKQVRLYVKNAEEARQWDWPLRLQQALGKNSLQIRVVTE